MTRAHYARRSNLDISQELAVCNLYWHIWAGLAIKDEAIRRCFCGGLLKEIEDMECHGVLVLDHELY